MTTTSEQTRAIIRWGHQHRRMLRAKYRRQFVACSATRILAAGRDWNLVESLATATGEPATRERAAATEAGSPGKSAVPASTIRAARSTDATALSAPTGKTSRAPTESQSSFVQQHSKVAGEIEKATGIPAGLRHDGIMRARSTRARWRWREAGRPTGRAG